MRDLQVEKNRLILKDEIECIFEQTVTKIGTGVKINCPKRYLGKSVYVIVRKDQEK